MNHPRSPRDFPVGVALVAVGCGVARTTPGIWRQRGEMPAPDLPEIAGEPIWWASTMALWAGDTGRVWDWDAAYEAASEVAAKRLAEPHTEPGDWPRRTVWRGGVPMHEPAAGLEWLDRAPALPQRLLAS